MRSRAFATRYTRGSHAPTPDSAARMPGPQRGAPARTALPPSQDPHATLTASSVA